MRGNNTLILQEIKTQIKKNHIVQEGRKTKTQKIVLSITVTVSIPPRWLHILVISGAVPMLVWDCSIPHFDWQPYDGSLRDTNHILNTRAPWDPKAAAIQKSGHSLKLLDA